MSGMRAMLAVTAMVVMVLCTCARGVAGDNDGTPDTAGPFHLDVLSDMSVEWYIDGGNITVTAEASGSVWVAVGWNGVAAMIGTDCVIGKSTAAVLAYSLTSKVSDGSGVNPQAKQLLTNTSFVQSNGKSVLKFTRPLSTPTRTISDSEVALVFAHGTGNVFQYHGSNRGTMTLNMYTASSAMRHAFTASLALLVAAVAFVVTHPL